MNAIPSVENLKQAIKLQEQIDDLQRQLAKLFGAASPPARASTAKRGPGKMSAAARARIAAAARARWAKVKAGANKTAQPAKASKKRKGALTPEGRARLAALMKARWAARKKGAPAPNAAAK